MSIDLEITARLASIAERLEFLSGITPSAALRRDETITARLKRIEDSLVAGVLEAHLLSAHPDVDSADAANGEFLKFDGTLWQNVTLVLGDLPSIALDNLSDVAIASGDSGDFLRHNGVNWIDDAIVLGDLPAIALDDLSDVSGSPSTNSVLIYSSGWKANLGTYISKLAQLTNVNTPSVAHRDVLTYNSGTTDWENFPKELFIWAAGDMPLTADWDAGANKITMEELAVIWAKDDTTENPAIITLTADDTADHDKSALFIDVNYDFNNAAALCQAEISAIDIDMDFTVTAAIVAIPVVKMFKGHLDYGTHVPIGSMFDVSATGLSNGAFGAAMATFTWTNAGNAGAVLEGKALVSSDGASGTNFVAGVQGASDGADVYTGNLIGLRGTCANSDDASGVFGLYANPQTSATTTALDKLMAIVGYAGHLLINGGSAAIVDITGTALDTMNGIVTTHLDFLNNLGELYVEGNAEFDGVIYADSDINVRGDIIFTLADAGLLYADLYGKNQSTVMSVVLGANTQVVIFTTAGVSNKAVPSAAQDHITVSDTGDYLVTMSASVYNDSGVAHRVSFGIAKNNGASYFNNLHMSQDLPTGTERQVVSISGIATLAANDTIEVWINSTDAVARNIIVEDIDLSLVMVGR